MASGPVLRRVRPRVLLPTKKPGDCYRFSSGWIVHHQRTLASISGLNPGPLIDADGTAKTALRAVGEGGPSGYGSFCLANIDFSWVKRGGRISRISRISRIGQIGQIGRIKSYSCTVYFSMNSTTGVGSSSPCGWWPTPGLWITSKTPPSAL